MKGHIFGTAGKCIVCFVFFGGVEFAHEFVFEPWGNVERQSRRAVRASLQACVCVLVSPKWQHQSLNPADCLDRVVEWCPTCRRPDTAIATLGRGVGLSWGRRQGKKKKKVLHNTNKHNLRELRCVVEVPSASETPPLSTAQFSTAPHNFPTTHTCTNTCARQLSLFL